MSSESFRTTVFQICKKMNTFEYAEVIKKLIHDISVIRSVGGNSTIDQKPNHGDLALISRSYNNQFLGYLLVDELAETINDQHSFQVSHFDDTERKIVETAHLTIKRFVDLCIAEIKDRYPVLSALVDPYAIYKIPNIRSESVSYLSDEDMGDCVESFKSSMLYKTVMGCESIRVFENTPPEVIRGLSISIDKMMKGNYTTTSDEISHILMKANGTRATAPDVLMIITIYLYALKRSLENAIQMLYESIIGNELIVFDNNNIIKLDGLKSVGTYNMYTVLCQGILFGRYGSRISSLVLLDCDTETGNHIKEFGSIISETVSFDRELGNTSKYSFVTVDEALNPIHSFTDMLIKSTLWQHIK